MPGIQLAPLLIRPFEMSLRKWHIEQRRLDSTLVQNCIWINWINFQNDPIASLKLIWGVGGAWGEEWVM